MLNLERQINLLREAITLASSNQRVDLSLLPQ